MAMNFGGLGRLFGRQGSGRLGGSSTPRILLSAASFTAGAAQGTAIGTLSVVGATGTPTFTINPADTHVQISGSALQVGPTSSSAGSFSVTIRVSGVTPAIADTPFLITATAAGGVALKADLSDANANEAWVFW
jgi:hypothetical protein